MREHVERFERKAQLKEISVSDDPFEDFSSNKENERSKNDEEESIASTSKGVPRKMLQQSNSLLLPSNCSEISYNSDEEDDKENSETKSVILPPPPHCHITIKNTREISGFNRLCEVLKRLDFKGAVWDQRRFNYICKLIELLTTKKFMIQQSLVWNQRCVISP